MGGGESSIIVLLSRLQAIPQGGLVVIEEVELGLHAEAQVRLIEMLIGYCTERRLQIICTTHSEAVIDAVPRRARVLLKAERPGA
jgi:predicted ATPase